MQILREPAISEAELTALALKFPPPDEAFEPVWITSREHLHHFLQIRETTRWYRLLLGRGYDVPEDFPYFSSGTQRIPLVYYSTGVLTIHGATVSYAAYSHQTDRRNLDTSLKFTVNSAEHPTLTRFRLPEAGLSYYSITWVELEARGFNAPVLLCIGGHGPGMGRINRDTDGLYDALAMWISRSQIR